MKMKKKWILVSVLIISIFLNCIIGFLLFLEPPIHESMLQAITTQKEVQRLTSPDGKIDAVIIESCGGLPPEPALLDVFVVLKGQKAKWTFCENKDRVFEGRFLQDLSIKWKKNRHLIINYSSGDIFYFRNNLTASNLQDSPLYDIEISESELIEPAQ
jgi:hypothetical protein